MSISSDYPLLITWLNIISHEFIVHPYLPLLVRIDALPLLPCSSLLISPLHVTSKCDLLSLLISYSPYSSYSSYPPWIDRYESIIATLCENLEDLDEPEVRTCVRMFIRDGSVMRSLDQQILRLEGEIWMKMWIKLFVDNVCKCTEKYFSLETRGV